MEAGTSLTPASWHAKPGAGPSRNSIPHASIIGDTSDSDAESTFTAPSGRLNSAGNSSAAGTSGQTRSIFRVSPAANRSPQTSFRRRSFPKASSSGAEDSVSLSNRSDSSSHQDHLAEDIHPQALERRPVSRGPSAAQLAVPKSAGRTRSPQRVAPAPGLSATADVLRLTC